MKRRRFDYYPKTKPIKLGRVVAGEAGGEFSLPEPETSPVCKHCGEPRSAHGGFARCPGGETQWEPK